MMEDNLYASHISALARKLILNKHAYLKVNTISNKVVLYIKNNENYNELNDDDKYNVLLYLQRYYNLL
jgi:sulfur relay (sulfurtransferase) DsrC/TusE family protein